MAKGSETPTWAWAGQTRNCCDCGRQLRVKDICEWRGTEKRIIRCCECMKIRTSRYVKVVNR